MTKELQSIIKRYRKEMISYFQANPQQRKEILANKKRTRKLKNHD